MYFYYFESAFYVRIAEQQPACQIFRVLKRRVQDIRPVLLMPAR